MEDLKGYGIIPLYIDITDHKSVDVAIDTIIKNEWRLDVLINNAWYGSFWAIEDVSIEEAKKQFEVNIFWLAYLTQKVLPIMRGQHKGKIINVSSVGGKMVTFLGGRYHATKYALEALSDALRMETKLFGIDVVIIEPGMIKTDWWEIAADHLEKSSKDGAYEQVAKKTDFVFRKQFASNIMSDPKVISDAISKAVNKKNPKSRYLVWFCAKPLVFLHLILPTKAFDWLMKKVIQLGGVE